MAIERAAPPKRSIGIQVYVAGGIAVLGLALFAYLQFGPNRPAPQLELTKDGQAYTKNLQLSDVTIKATGSFANQTLVEVQGKIYNAGNRGLDTVEIYCVFRDSFGQVLYKPRVAIVSQKMGGLKPGETKAFRLPFDEVPDDWNQALPQLVIAGVKFS